MRRSAGRRSPGRTGPSSTASRPRRPTRRRAARRRASRRCPTTATTRASTTGRAATRPRAAPAPPRPGTGLDDGTGSGPGPELHPRHFDQEQASTASDGSPRRCWDSRKDAKVPAGDDRFWQGDIGTHGLHLLFLAESDNARMTVPLTEIVSEWRMAMLPGNPGNVGGKNGRSFEKPLVATVQKTYAA